MWAPDQSKVNKGKIVIRRSQSSTIAPCQGIQDSLGFWIPVELGFQISFLSQILTVFWIPKPWIPDSISKIFPDSGFYKQNFPGSRIRIPLRGVKYKSNIFGPVHAYLIKQWEIYFSSNFRFYNMMDRSNILLNAGFLDWTTF